MSVSDVAATLHSLHKLQVVTYLHVAGTALLVIDWFLTIGDEITYAWTAPWNLGKVLFFLTRYPAFVDSALTLYHQVGYHLSTDRCVILFRVTGWMIIIGIVIAEIILVLRVWAVYERSRKIGIFLILFSIACVIVAAVGFVKFHGSQTFTAMDSFAPNVPGCYPDGGTNIVYVDFIVLLVFETVTLGMTVIKAVQHFRQGTSSFVYTFFQDGIMYYAVLQAISLVNVVVLFLHIREYTNLVTSLQRSLHAVLSARILLHLREEAVKVNVGGGAELGIPANGTVGEEQLGELVFAGDGDARRSGRRGGRSRWAGDTSWFGEGSMGVSSGIDTGTESERDWA
ncbi:hypothetical protein BDQ12DRAFT_326505 [Crucibulum laeve]|uniref:DUF6533 domain-containing protein n=1 Tax=Crucibulum laeve TaxID=68775 RepID=A0A5C3LQL3_9AGAR|nr:hypothetical protein BDQ12DRAFT_326505 [Crucibulum laeve]